MYKITVPININTLERNGFDKTLAELKRVDAERILLCFEPAPTQEEEQNNIDLLKKYCPIFKSLGYEVGQWSWCLTMPAWRNFTKMRTTIGEDVDGFSCPGDKDFVEYYVNRAKRIAESGVDLIQLDDDFMYGLIRDGHPTCLCDIHIARIRDILGESCDIEKLKTAISTGEKNKYRDAFLKANADILYEYAAAIRAGVDEINPQIRIGYCASITWDVSGVDAEKIARIFAGNTKPFIRLIGAPYWANNGLWGHMWGNSLPDVVELERRGASWIKGKDVELIAEGDTFPRPRIVCPASYLEGYDMAVRASGATDGILKYAVDYHANTGYESGYASAHEKNRHLYKEIDRVFSGKESVGVRVYEATNKIANLTVPTKTNQSWRVEELFFSKAAHTLSHCSVPTVYDGEGTATIVFDENARSIPLEMLSGGVIIDALAAEILMERGVDVGIESFGDGIVAGLEHFMDNDNYIIADEATVYNIKLRKGAEILSETSTISGDIPVSYRYENADGQRFLVLNINTRHGADCALRQYDRSRQYAENIPWLSGKKLPAYVYGCPSLYVQCKKNKNSTAVGLWNFFADSVENALVELDCDYSSAEFINCTGKLDKDTLHIDTIAPFGFAAIELKK